MPTLRPPARGLIVVTLLACVSLVLSGCTLSEATTIDPQGDHGRRIYELILPLFWAGLGVFVIVEGILLYSVFRFRRKPNSGMPSQTHGNLRVEILWTIAPALIVLVIAILTFRTQALNSVQPVDALQINATGRQWYFAFEYPEQGVVTATDMYIPVGQPVTVNLRSGDVIHSFWAPRLAGKTDMIPPHTNKLSFTAEQAGLYRGQCAEFCGEAHAQMIFNVIALEPADFERWVELRRAPPPFAKETGAGATTQATAGAAGATQATAASTVQPTPTIQPTPIPLQQPTAPQLAADVAPPIEGDPERGALVFERRGCIGCHRVDNDPAGLALLGPNLAYYGSRTEIAAGVLPNTNENLAKWLRNPDVVKPGNLMANVVQAGTLTEREISDLVAYLNGQTVDVAVPAASK
jgi:cytochrome c oxidase subunit 2